MDTVEKFTEAGMFHKTEKNENQDAVSSRSDSRFSAIALADGASSCRYAKSGADIACQTMADILLEKQDFFINSAENSSACILTDYIKDSVRRKAQDENAPEEDYASTCAGILWDRSCEKLFYYNLGDSLILMVRNNRCTIISQPSLSSQGCFTTATENAEITVKTGVVDTHDAKSAVILSDGAWRKLLSRNRLRKDVKDIVESGDYSELKNYLMNQNFEDDASFIALCRKKEA